MSAASAVLIFVSSLLALFAMTGAATSVKYPDDARFFAILGYVCAVASIVAATVAGSLWS